VSTGLLFAAFTGADRRNGAVEIAVTDTGPGVAPEDQAAILEEFRQVGSRVA
jgi:signal transduction histidine kinase